MNRQHATETYLRELADYKARCDAATAAIRIKLGNPRWTPRSWVALGVGPPPENPVSRMRAL